MIEVNPWDWKGVFCPLDARGCSLGVHGQSTLVFSHGPLSFCMVRCALFLLRSAVVARVVLRPLAPRVVPLGATMTFEVCGARGEYSWCPLRRHSLRGLSPRASVRSWASLEGWSWRPHVSMQLLPHPFSSLDNSPKRSATLGEGTLGVL